VIPLFPEFYLVAGLLILLIHTASVLIIGTQKDTASVAMLFILVGLLLFGALPFFFYDFAQARIIVSLLFLGVSFWLVVATWLAIATKKAGDQYLVFSLIPSLAVLLFALVSGGIVVLFPQ